jgi:hypothetical protein
LLASWDNFFVAQVGASAALAGLLFVGLSINMNRILQFPVLPDRALEALTLLFTILVVSSLLLVPGIGSLELGVEVLVAGAAAAAILTAIASRVLRKTDPRWQRPRRAETVMIETVVALYLAGGVVLVVVGTTGLFVLVPAILVSYMIAIMISWVLLVEVNR